MGAAAFEAAYLAAPAPLFYLDHLQEGLGVHKPEMMYLIMSQRPDAFVDISAVWGQKMRAVKTFQSQGRHLPGGRSSFNESRKIWAGRQESFLPRGSARFHRGD